jgi:transcription elongation factor GreA
MEETVYVTKAGLDKMSAEIQRLKFEERPKISEKVATARELGDLKENAEYHAAREELSLMEAKIKKMEIRLSRAKVIDLDEIEEGKVYIFTRVTVKDLHSNKQFTYSLVPEDDADFAAGKISVHSPIAKGLLGLRAGESAEIQVPAGVKRLEVLSIERIAE